MQAYSDNLVLLLPFEKPSIVDISPAHRTVTNTNVSLVDTPNKWGIERGSAGFNGVSSLCSVPVSSNENFGTGDFTVEAWVYPNSLPSNYFFINGGYLSSPNVDYFFGGRNGSLGFGRHNIAWDTEISSVLLTAIWQHVAACRISGTLRLFANGVKKKESTNTIDYRVDSNVIEIGKGYTYYSSCYMQDVRVIKGLGIYASDFTPPARLTLDATASGNLTVSGNGAGDYVAIIDVTTKELVKLVEPGTGGDWTADVPEGEYYALYFGDGCQPICHGPYTITAT